MQQRSRRRAEYESGPIQLDDDAARPNTGYAQPDDDLIARRAYERYEARGGEHGRDQEDWFEAEREIRGDSGSPVSGAKTSSD